VKYVVVFEQTPENFSAYVPDLPGCVATGVTRDEVESRIREAVTAHVRTLRDEHEPVPEPGAWAEVLEA
jgi:predicted RNase H-like HicB family nuclease